MARRCLGESLTCALLASVLAGCAYYEQVRITTEPPGAYVSVDGDCIGQSPVSYGPPDGIIYPVCFAIPSVAVQADKAGYESAYRTIKPRGSFAEQDNWPEHVHIPLQPIGAASGGQQQQQQQQQQTVVIPGAEKEDSPQRGNVLLTSTPEQCDVYIDGAFVGNTPMKLSAEEGLHILEVKKDGFASIP